SPDGRLVAFSIRQHGHARLYTARADGTRTRMVSDSLELEGAPAWAPDGHSIATGADDRGIPRLYRIPLDGGSPVAFVQDYARDPAWAPDGSTLLYSGADIGTTFPVTAASAGATRATHALTLTRGARHLAFLPGGRLVVFLRGDLRHRDLWQLDLQTGAQQPLVQFPGDFDIADFDVAPDGHEAVVERVQ